MGALFECPRCGSYRCATDIPISSTWKLGVECINCGFIQSEDWYRMWEACRIIECEKKSAAKKVQ